MKITNFVTQDGPFLISILLPILRQAPDDLPDNIRLLIIKTVLSRTERRG